MCEGGKEEEVVCEGGKEEVVCEREVGGGGCVCVCEGWVGRSVCTGW